MAIAQNPHQIIPFEKLPMSHLIQQKALTKLLVERGIFTGEEFWERVKGVDREWKGDKRGLPTVEK